MNAVYVVVCVSKIPEVSAALNFVEECRFETGIQWLDVRPPHLHRARTLCKTGSRVECSGEQTECLLTALALIHVRSIGFDQISSLAV